MCSLVAHDLRKPAFEDYESSLGDKLVPKNATIEELESLVDTLNFIEIWIKLLDRNYEVRR